VPADEVIFVPTVPFRIEQVNAVVGDAASGPLLTITNHQLVIDSSLRLEEAPLIRPGMPVAIDEPDLGIKATGVVGTVADTPGTFGVDGFHIYFEVLVDETPTLLEGVSLRLTVPVESTGGAVMAVPVSALSLAADGTSRVQVDNSGTLEFITVEPGLSADGFVEVSPIDGTLTPGQLVVVGYEKPL
jgi:multidrug efflux pump subunit AcrA (membrane-fusion protein)